jgi:tetratricopeptide (TPR) repeat protein
MPAFHIDIEPAQLLSASQELAVLRAALRRQPDSALLRGRLATALLVQDQFDDAIALLGGGGTPDAREAGMLVQAHLARESEADNRRVIEIVDRLLPLVDDAVIRAQFLADAAKAQRRLGDVDAARAALEAALALDPANKDACKRIAALALDVGEPAHAISMLDRLAAQGAGHARLHAARALAHARAGRIDASREAIGFDALHYRGMLEPPAGIADIDAFNDALAAELVAHPALRYDRYGTASEQTWRIDTPLLGEAPMVRLLLDQIARAAERHVATLDGHDHPWASERPDRGLLHCWCVMTDGIGYETWHVHQFGWMSGVYYVRIPPSIVMGEGPGGCIAFGLPEELAGDASAARYGTRLVRPEEGMLMLFPSHSYHRTFPHGADERRICVAFDIWPA